VVGPRLLNSSQWGFIDPIDTPDGGNIGLHKHMAISTYITSGSSSLPIIKWLRVNTSLMTLLECSPIQFATGTKVFVNGNWIGMIDKPISTDKTEIGLVDFLKLNRRNGIIPIYTSISFDYEHNELHIYTDAGRLTRPIYYIENGKVSFERKEIVDLLMNGKITWEQIVSGFDEKKDPLFNSKNNILYDLKELYPNISDKSKEHILETLLTHKSAVDYIDTAEEETALIAVNYDDMKKNKRYTHLEIDPSLILGIMGNLIIYPENNPVTRNSFSCGQSKQAVSVYHSNYQMRIDKMGVVLNYGQTPLIKSRYMEYINNEEQPYGINAIVAIMSYTGYNVEDAILINEAAIHRGIFRTTYYSMYEAREESSKVTGMNNSKFANIEENNVIGKKQGYDYSHLDKYGLIKENMEINDKIILIGKIMSNLENKQLWIDESVKTKKGQLGYVDKSFITLGEEGFNVAKVRIREERLPAIGDKMACALPTQQVLTDKGWIEIQHVDITYHKLATLDKHGNMCYEYPTNKFEYDHVGKMYSLKTPHVEVVCTLNHKLYIKTRYLKDNFILETAENTIGKMKTFKKDLNNAQYDLDLITINEVELRVNDFLFLLQSKYIYDKHNFKFTVQSIFSIKEEKLPEYVWLFSKKQCSMLLNILEEIETNSIELANEISRFYVHSGYSGVIKKQKNYKYNVTIVYNNEPLIYDKCIDETIIDYDGKVYCVEMPSSHLYYMREHIFAPSMLIGNSRAGQKGTLGLIIPECDMPFTSDGLKPDLIINPHALPSRMTIGQIVESLFGKVCLSYGAFGDCTAFQVKGANFSTYAPLLVNAGFHSSGNQVMYNGMSGDQLEADIYIGPTYYMRLKHMVKDKINYRARGPNTSLTRQPVQGRANDGGLRIGEMERDGVLAHGMSYFLNESFLVRGDEYYIAVCNKSGAIAIYNEAKNLFLSPYVDGPINFSTNHDGSQSLKNISRFGRSFSILRIPYSFKLLIQELQVMNVQMRIITDDNVDKLMSLSYSNNISKLLNEKEDLKQNISTYDSIIKTKLNEFRNQPTLPEYEAFKESELEPLVNPNELNELNELNDIPYPDVSPAYVPIYFNKQAPVSPNEYPNNTLFNESTSPTYSPPPQNLNNMYYEPTSPSSPPPQNLNNMYYEPTSPSSPPPQNLNNMYYEPTSPSSPPPKQILGGSILSVNNTNENTNENNTKVISIDKTNEVNTNANNSNTKTIIINKNEIK